MRVVFGRRLSIGSIAIRMFTWSQWSHCGVITDRDTVIESTSKDGVIETTLDNFKTRYPDYIILNIPARKGWFTRLSKEMGKPYDWGAIFGIVFRKKWSSPSRWFCSELVAHASGVFNEKYINRITPQHIVLVGKET